MNEPLTAEQVLRIRILGANLDASKMLADSHELIRAQRDEAQETLAIAKVVIAKELKKNSALRSRLQFLQLCESEAARYKSERDEARARVTGLESKVAVYETLTRRLQEVHADERYQAVWQIFMLHGGSYTEPTYTAEFQAALAALSADPLTLGNSAMETYVCTICGSQAKWEPEAQVWRHAGEPSSDAFLTQTFCDKYGYPIEVRALSVAMKEKVWQLRVVKEQSNG